MEKIMSKKVKKASKSKVKLDGDPNKTPEENIIAHLEAKGSTMTWLAGKIGLSIGHLQVVLKGCKGLKRPLTEANRQKINEVLEKNY